MTKKKDGEASKTGAAAGTVNFNCKRCNKPRPLSEMRVLTRFFPMEIVCRDCEKAAR